MIEFSDLQIVKQVEVEIPVVNTKRYVIGADPAFQEGVLSGINVFTVYDKYVMRYISKTRTKMPFDQFVEWVLRESNKTVVTYPKREIIISKKFINVNGTATNPVQVR